MRPHIQRFYASTICANEHFTQGSASAQKILSLYSAVQLLHERDPNDLLPLLYIFSRVTQLIQMHMRRYFLSHILRRVYGLIYALVASEASCII